MLKEMRAAWTLARRFRAIKRMRTHPRRPRGRPGATSILLPASETSRQNSKWIPGFDG